MYGLGIVVAPAIGPTLGGYLVEYVDWRLIFLINVPVGIIGTIAAVLFLPYFGPAPVGRFDVLGFGTVAIGLVSLLLALTEGQSWGWTSYRIIILFAVSLVFLALFVIIELEVENPLLDVRVFRHLAYTNSLLLISVLSVGLFAVLFYIPLLLQQARGLGAFDTGLLLLPQALVMGVLMPSAGMIYDKFGPRWPAAIGLALTAVGTYLLTDVTLDTSNADVVWLLVMRSAGMGLAMMPIMTGGIAAVPPDMVDGAGAFNTVVQRASAALGLAALTSLVTSSRAQLSQDRGALVAPDTPMPALGTGPTGDMMGMYAVSQQTQTLAFVESMHGLFIVTAIITALGIPLALMMRSGPSTSRRTPAPVSPPPRRPAVRLAEPLVAARCVRGLRGRPPAPGWTGRRRGYWGSGRRRPGRTRCRISSPALARRWPSCWQVCSRQDVRRLRLPPSRRLTTATGRPSSPRRTRSRVRRAR